MSTYCIKSCWLFGFLACSFLGFSQSDYSVFSEPALAINHKASSNYSLSFSFKGRNYIYDNNNVHINQRQLEINHFSTWNFNSKSNVSFGFMYRNRMWFEDSSNEIRLTGQFNFKKSAYHLRFGHRFRLEQRFFENLVVHRLRYRFALDFPLSGEKLDIGEAYLVVTTELLWSVSKHLPNLDNRTGVYIGWYKSKTLNLQLGVEHQFIGINQKLTNSLFVLPAVILRL